MGASLAFQHNGYTFSTAPPLVLFYVPIWVKVIGPGAEAPFILVGHETSGAIDVVAETQSGLQFLNGRFDTTARTALASVSAHTGDLVVADEATAGNGGLAASAVRAIVTWAGDTSIRAGLTQTYQLMTGTTTSNANTSFAPTARAYSASTGKLYAFKKSGGWKLYAFDVASALAGSPTSTNVHITGVTPGSPAAMAYNVRDGNLYVVDSIHVGAALGLRLYRLSTTGVATELWRTTSDTSPPSTFLSVSTTGELVLGLVRGASFANEVALMDTEGKVWWSTSSTGLLLQRPVANESGVSIGHTDATGQNATSTLFVARPSMTKGLCGTTWLKAHVDGSVYTPLGYPGGDCP